MATADAQHASAKATASANKEADDARFEEAKTAGELELIGWEQECGKRGTTFCKVTLRDTVTGKITSYRHNGSGSNCGSTQDTCTLAQKYAQFAQ